MNRPCVMCGRQRTPSPWWLRILSPILPPPPFCHSSDPDCHRLFAEMLGLTP